MQVNYLKKHIEVRKEVIENELKIWEENKQDLLDSDKDYKKHDDLKKTKWGNRIAGHLNSLKFCLKEINELLELDCVKNFNNKKEDKNAS